MPIASERNNTHVRTSWRLSAHQSARKQPLVVDGLPAASVLADRAVTCAVDNDAVLDPASLIRAHHLYAVHLQRTSMRRGEKARSHRSVRLESCWCRSTRVRRHAGAISLLARSGASRPSATESTTAAFCERAARVLSRRAPTHKRKSQLGPAVPPAPRAHALLTAVRCRTTMSTIPHFQQPSRRCRATAASHQCRRPIAHRASSRRTQRTSPKLASMPDRSDMVCVHVVHVSTQAEHFLSAHSCTGEVCEAVV